MSYFSVLMFIFATLVLLFGLYIYKGHDVSKLFVRASFKNLTKEEWINIGKWTMIVSLFIILIGVLGIIFNVE